MFSGNLLLLSGQEAQSKAQEIEVAISKPQQRLSTSRTATWWIGSAYFTASAAVFCQIPVTVLLSESFWDFADLNNRSTKIPLNLISTDFDLLPKLRCFFPEIFQDPNFPTRLKSRPFFSERFFGRFFFASWFNPITFSAPALPMFGVVLPKHHNKHHQNWNNKSSPKKPIQGLLDECLWKWLDFLCFFLATVCAKA